MALPLSAPTGSAIYRDGTANDANRWCAPFKGHGGRLLSTRWFVKRYEEISGEAVADVKALVARIGVDDRIPALFNEFAVNLGTFLTTFIQEEQPEIAVIGGNIANAADLFLAQLKKELEKQQITIPVSYSYPRRSRSTDPAQPTYGMPSRKHRHHPFRRKHKIKRSYWRNDPKQE